MVDRLRQFRLAGPALDRFGSLRASWPRLKRRIDRIRADRGDVEAQLEAFKTAIRGADPGEARRLLHDFPVLREQLDEPLFEFGRPTLLLAKSSLIDVLLEFGADVNVRSRRERGSFGVLDGADPDAAEHRPPTGRSPRARRRNIWRRTGLPSARSCRERGGMGGE